MGAWLFLSIAIGFEVAATIILKLSEGFERPWWVAGSMLAYGVCFLFFAPAIKVIPVGIAYAIWAGLGIVAVSVIGVLFFGDSLSIPQIGFITLLIVSAVGLRMTTAI